MVCEVVQSNNELKLILKCCGRWQFQFYRFVKYAVFQFFFSISIRVLVIGSSAVKNIFHLLIKFYIFAIWIISFEIILISQKAKYPQTTHIF
jgi:hypothetical protein